MSLRRGCRVLGLVLFGMGLSHCKGDPDVGDAGVDAGVPPIQTVLRDAYLLDVDARQQWLVAMKSNGGGTVVQDLATGATRRIAPTAASGRFTSDGNALVLTFPSQEGLSTAWLWRPGDAEASVMGTRIWGRVAVKEGATPYVAFVERTADGGADLSRVFPPECDGRACQVETVAQVEAGLATEPVLLAGERFLWTTLDTRGWAFDTELGMLAEAGGDPAYSLHISPSGNRFARLTPERHVQVYDTRTQALLWEVAAPQGNGSVTRAAFFDDDTFLIGTSTPSYPPPPEQNSYSCTSQGCTWMGSTVCEPRTVRGGTVISCAALDCFGNRCTMVYRLMRRPGEEFSSVGELIERAPAVSDDLTSAVWMTYALRDSSSGPRNLRWNRASRSLTFPAGTDMTVFDFVPGEQRFVFVNPIAGADGGVEKVLSVWDGETVEGVGVVEGRPSHPLTRAHPPAIYLNDTQRQSDGGATSPVIRRFAL
ncbi:hypothetical protein JYK02_01305 [Corallococcus macrosporus]|uniref:Lipoprotein n=1 Tax=Corallococcus macrosporus TaxID=35 RepID=A0ABS3D512_9BACT|nr:hypothetical protein [Corallococcus macrosporus]MBN8226140.1 hypothetical protein [Corallococcus macrosporus]